MNDIENNIIVINCIELYKKQYPKFYSENNSKYVDKYIIKDNEEWVYFDFNRKYKKLKDIIQNLSITEEELLKYLYKEYNQGNLKNKELYTLKIDNIEIVMEMYIEYKYCFTLNMYNILCLEIDDLCLKSNYEIRQKIKLDKKSDENIQRWIVCEAIKQSLYDYGRNQYRYSSSNYKELIFNINKYILSFKRNFNKRIKYIQMDTFIRMSVQDLNNVKLDINIKDDKFILNNHITTKELHKFIDNVVLTSYQGRYRFLDGKLYGSWENELINNILNIKEKLRNNQKLTNNDYELLEKELMIKRDYISN